MPAIPKTPDNPHGLSGKQRLVIADLLRDVETKGRMDIKKSHRLVYGKQTDSSIAVTTTENLKRPNFREALIDGLNEKKIIGINGKVGRVLMQGLDALTEKGAVDHKTRLLYVQEINKIIGVYAPDKVEKKSMHLHVNVTDEELQNNINKLQQELGYAP